VRRAIALADLANPEVRGKPRIEAVSRTSETLPSLQIGTETLATLAENKHMTQKKRKKHSSKTTRASVRDEMAKPRVTKSARIAQLDLDTRRRPEPATLIMDGIVLKIVRSHHVDTPDSAQISLSVTEKQHRDLRIENSLTDEHGDDVKLKKGAPVEVTVTAKDESVPS
jgi:hypothetical protein